MSTRHKGFLLLVFPLGEVAEVARLINEHLWTIHEGVCRAIIPSTFIQPEEDSVLICEDKTVLLPLGAASTNICRRASSVLDLIATNGFVGVNGFLWAHCWLRSGKPVQEGLDHLFWCDLRLWRGVESEHLWCNVKWFIAEAIDIVGCKVLLGAC